MDLRSLPIEDDDPSEPFRRSGPRSARSAHCGGMRDVRFAGIRSLWRVEKRGKLQSRMHDSKPKAILQDPIFFHEPGPWASLVSTPRSRASDTISDRDVRGCDDDSSSEIEMTSRFGSRAAGTAIESRAARSRSRRARAGGRPDPGTKARGGLHWYVSSDRSWRLFPCLHYRQSLSAQKTCGKEEMLRPEVVTIGKRDLSSSPDH